eukprot:CAMPEP_0194545408 /NCGR_PEP_ID=MMETSP0253-20130528/89134_1 /TAXON_ID=2966 /ORGANISM="Noctiluca scintillans" /LENGTH=46 /DNA_ID= /DNA_START= /DNA_END= /DNA_ORIENTATION=
MNGTFRDTDEAKGLETHAFAVLELSHDCARSGFPQAYHGLDRLHQI